MVFCAQSVHRAFPAATASQAFKAAAILLKRDLTPTPTPTPAVTAREACRGHMCCRIRQVGIFATSAVNAGQTLAVPRATAAAPSKLPLAVDDRTCSVSQSHPATALATRASATAANGHPPLLFALSPSSVIPMTFALSLQSSPSFYSRVCAVAGVSQRLPCHRIAHSA